MIPFTDISSPAVIQASGQIIGNEGRQNSYQRTVLGLDFFNGEWPAMLFSTAPRIMCLGTPSRSIKQLEGGS